MKQVALQNPSLDSKERRFALSKAFFNLTKLWGLKRDEEAQLLGWSYQEKRTQLDNMRKGRSPLPHDRDKFERVVDLLNIHKSLRLLFPYDQKTAYQWVQLPRKRFGNHSALEIMFEDGKEGITAIRRYLDYERTR